MEVLHLPLTWWLVGAAIATAGIGVWVHDYFEGERLLADQWDLLGLRRTPLSEFDARWAANPRKSDVIVSLTTVPSRIDQIDDTLKSLMRQTRAPAEIRLYVPERCEREGTAYDIPERLRALSAVRICACEDWGPATKIIPALSSLDPDRLLIAVDDDRIYAATLVEDLERNALRSPEAAFGMSGWVVPADLVDRPNTPWLHFSRTPPAPIKAIWIKRPFEVDVLEGHAGYLVRPRFFDLVRLRDYSKAPACARLVDDVWISAHCGRPKFVIPARRANFGAKDKYRFHFRTGIDRINRGDGPPERRNNTILLKYLGDVWRVGGPRSATW